MSKNIYVDYPLCHFRAKLLRPDIIDVVSPLVDHGGHVFWKPGVELDPFAGAWVDEAESLGVKGLARAELEAVLDELAVLGVDCAFADL